MHAKAFAGVVGFVISLWWAPTIGHTHSLDQHKGEIMKIEKTEAEWREILTPDQFAVLRQEATEPAGSSPLDKIYDDGVYVCAGCDLPLFKSEHKYDSRTGWPSFWQPIEGHINTKPDNFLWYQRTEYHCARCGGHQGHVFDDGPKEHTGKRYCNNGIALKFIPHEKAAK